MLKILFLCTGNSCRSHMAEGLLRKLGGDAFEVCSAGAKPAGFVHPLAIAVMQEIDIDISRHTSKSLDVFDGQKFDYLITVCDNARDTCPVFTAGAERIHWSFEDPAAVQGTGEERLAAFRRIRGRIHDRVKTFLRDRTAAAG